MEQNFFEQRLKKASEIHISIFISILSLIVIVIVSLLTFHEQPSSSGDTIFGIVFDLLFYMVFIVGFIVPLIVIKQEKRLLNKYSGDNKLNALILYDTSENVQDVYNYINNAIADNQILFRHQAFFREKDKRKRTDKNNETILLPKYLLDCTRWRVTAIPINDVRVVAEKDYFNRSAFDSPPLTKGDEYSDEELKANLRKPSIKFNVVSIYYGDQKAIGIECGVRNSEMAEQLARELNSHLPKKL